MTIRACAMCTVDNRLRLICEGESLRPALIGLKPQIRVETAMSFDKAFGLPELRTLKIKCF